LLRKWGLPEARPKAPWQYDITLDKFFMDDECLRIEKIIICTPDDDEPDDWTPLLEISGPEKIKKAVEALETARRGFMPAWSNRMKIITENKKFIMKFDCNDKIAYGTHWESKEFRDLLREWGFPEPKPSYSPQGHEKVPRKIWRGQQLFSKLCFCVDALAGLFVQCFLQTVQQVVFHRHIPAHILG